MIIDVSWCTEADTQTRLTPAHPDSKDRSFTAERQSGAGAAGSDDDEGGEFENYNFCFHLNPRLLAIKTYASVRVGEVMTLEPDE